MNIQITIANKYFFGIFIKRYSFMSFMFCNMNMLYTWTPFWKDKKRRLLVYDEEDIEGIVESAIKIVRINQYLQLNKDTLFAIYNF